MGLHVGSQPSQPRINVTPLVDIVLVLLIIFIVITPAVEARVKLPTARHSPAAEQERSLTITLLNGGQAEIQDALHPVRRLALEGSAEEWAKLGSLETRSVLVQADARCPFREVQSLLDRLRGLGAQQAQLVTRTEGKEGAA